MKRIIIIGGLSAGPSAAAKARRENEDAEILLFEKSSNISYATCGIPYALSGKINSRKKLIVVEAELLKNRFNVDMHLEEEVVEILPDVNKIVTSKGEYEYDKLVYAAGAHTFIPPVKNIEIASNWSPCRSLEDYDKVMKEAIPESAKHITVMGAGLIGVEVVENLRELGKEVTLIEGSSQVLPMWEPKFSHFARRTMQEHGVEVITDSFVKELKVEQGNITEVKISDTQSVKTDYVLMSVGIRPNTEMLTSKGAEHIGNGALKVNERMETSLPNVYAAGDCASIKNLQTGEYDYLPLGTHSNKGGRTAGQNAAGGSDTFEGGYKTAIIKVFEKTLARTGMNPSFMDKQGIEYKTNLILAGATPGYYPDQKEMIVETYYKPEDGTILGCELFGEHGVDKRVDVMSTAIYAKLKISDLPKLDLAYAPPFSPAKDPVVVSGYVSSNALNANYSEVSVEELQNIIAKEDKGSYQIVDVRTKGEIAKLGKINDAIEIPVDELRNNLEKLDKSKTTYVYCAKGLRGYLSFLILQQNEFEKLHNLSGGYTIWNYMN
ncbi:FAD-dependent oxidoreductase [Carboxylicivirga marina]|uniref:FAD-dependent oxidoreductase n=1 Tax=Carboxylicivirga marina TaxID=2800988 RepID=A0ABS1HKT2_9BACT|nr:FAD-dependent oxidoreductase [Carboxylicivirga marina]MBK3517759.1 FAD-dependent oxidoreductase [Carboxylicivirga marina]